MPIKKSLRERFQSEEKMIGSWVALADFRSAELLVDLGFDFLIVDMQHGEPTETGLMNLLAAFRGSSVTPLVRVPHHEYRTINRVLDLGFPGILAPLVSTAEQAEQIVRAAKYPPMGARSYGPMPAPAQRIPPASYIEEANNSTAVTILIEHIRALRDLDEILSVPGIDAVFVGVFDLTFSLRESAEMQALADAAVQRAKKEGRVPPVGSETSRFVPAPGEVLAWEILHKSQEKGIPFGVICHTPEEALTWFERGAQWPTLLSDYGFLRNAASTGLNSIREGMAGK